jgi:hypothetical protein
LLLSGATGMISRLATILIFLFCGTMTALLVRSVLHPGASRFSAVAPEVPFNYFAARVEGSHLDIWDANRIIGSCELTPHSGEPGPGSRRDKVKVRMEVTVNAGQQLIDASGHTVLHSSGELTDFSLDLSLPRSRPVIKLAIRQKDGRHWPALTLTRGGELLFQSDGETGAGGVHSAMVDLMLKSTGLSLEALAAKESGEATSASARAGHFEAGGQTFDGYLLTGSGGDDSGFRLYLSNTGEILRIDTPLTGDNGLGLRMLSASLRPAGAKPPDLNKYALPPPPHDSHP